MGINIDMENDKRCNDLLDDLECINTLINNAMSLARVLDYDSAMKRVEFARKYLNLNIPETNHTVR